MKRTIIALLALSLIAFSLPALAAKARTRPNKDEKPKAPAVETETPVYTEYPQTLKVDEKDKYCKISVINGLSPAQGALNQGDQNLCSARIWSYFSPDVSADKAKWNWQDRWGKQEFSGRRDILREIHGRFLVVDAEAEKVYAAAADVYRKAELLQLLKKGKGKQSISAATAGEKDAEKAEVEAIELVDKAWTDGASPVPGGEAALREIIEPLTPTSDQAVAGKAIQKYYEALLKLRAVLIAQNNLVGSAAGLNSAARSSEAMEKAMASVTFSKSSFPAPYPVSFWSTADGYQELALSKYGYLTRNRVAGDFWQVQAIYAKAKELVAASTSKNIRDLLALIRKGDEQRVRQGIKTNVDLSMVKRFPELGAVEAEVAKHPAGTKEGDAWREKEGKPLVDFLTSAGAVREGEVTPTAGDKKYLIFTDKSGKAVYTHPTAVADLAQVSGDDQGVIGSKVADALASDNEFKAKWEAAKLALKGMGVETPPTAGKDQTNPAGGQQASAEVRKGAAQGSMMPSGCSDKDRYQGFANQSLDAVQDQAVAYSNTSREKEKWAEDECAKFAKQKTFALKAFDEREADSYADAKKREEARAARGRLYDDKCEAARNQAAIELAKLAKEGKGPGSQDPAIWTRGKMQSTAQTLQAAYDNDLRGILSAVEKQYLPKGSRNAGLAKDAKVQEGYMASPSGAAVVGAFFKGYGTDADIKECREAHNFNEKAVLDDAAKAQLVTPTADTVAEKCVHKRLTAFIGDPANRDKNRVAVEVPTVQTGTLDDEAKKIREQADARRKAEEEARKKAEEAARKQK